MSQTGAPGRFRVVDASGKVMDGIAVGEPVLDFDHFFESHYGRIARVIARVVRDPARAEELAVDVFWKFWKFRKSDGVSAETAGAWVYRAGVRAGLDELRRQVRRGRYERLLGRFSGTRNPEQLHAASEEQDQVRAILVRLNTRQSELLVLRADGLSYEELASALRLSPGSIGTLLTRAQQAFRKEYVKNYGEPRYER